jgi:hypothetical protein
MTLSDIFPLWPVRRKEVAPTPHLAERRLTHRLKLYWEDKRCGREFPALADIVPAEIAELWPWCFLLDVGQSRAFPYFRYLGFELSRYSGVFLSGETDWASTLLDKAVANYADVLSHRLPVVIEDEISRFDRRMLLFRATLLPLSTDGNRIDYVLGAANGKLVDDLPRAGAA